MQPRLLPNLQDVPDATPILRTQPRRNTYSQDPTQTQHLFSGLNPDAPLRVPPLHIPDLGHNLFRESIKIVY